MDAENGHIIITHVCDVHDMQIETLLFLNLPQLTLTTSISIRFFIVLARSTTPYYIYKRIDRPYLLDRNI